MTRTMRTMRDELADLLDSATDRAHDLTDEAHDRVLALSDHGRRRAKELRKEGRKAVSAARAESAWRAKAARDALAGHRRSRLPWILGAAAVGIGVGAAATYAAARMRARAARRQAIEQEEEMYALEMMNGSTVVGVAPIPPATDRIPVAKPADTAKRGASATDLERP
ncbi:hypothetical protein [Hamadaea tsunoensis]|uniref:hypothetical protein n=1 Tax=Hamadaea tsunoensis TaxID=53368 RepID=UPI0012FA7BA4|nr:hypothetical protein [Hamadaea tsunoensis]